MIADADQLDAVAPVGRRGGREPRLEQAHGLVGGVLAQRVVATRAAARSIRAARCSRRDRATCSAATSATAMIGAATSIRRSSRQHRDGCGREHDAGHHRQDRRPDADHRMRERERCRDQPGRAGDLERALQARRPRHRPGEPAMHQVAGDEGHERDQHEGRVGGPAVERDRRQEVVHQQEGRRIGAERVEQHQRRRDGEEANLAREGDAADEAEATISATNGKRAGIDLAHVLREVEAGPTPGGVPDQALRRPIFDASGPWRRTGPRRRIAADARGGSSRRPPTGIRPRDGSSAPPAASVMITGMAATRTPATPPAASGLTLARTRSAGRSPAIQCASTNPAST